MWSETVVNYANQAGIDPRLLLAVLIREEKGSESSGPIDDAAQWIQWFGERSGFYEKAKDTFTSKGGSPASLGWGNMQEKAFNETKDAHSGEFSGDDTWSELINNDDLAIKAMAFRLYDLQKIVRSEAPENLRKAYSPEQLTAAAYNVGTDNIRTDFRSGSLSSDATEYATSTGAGIAGPANAIICGSGVWVC